MVNSLFATIVSKKMANTIGSAERKIENINHLKIFSLKSDICINQSKYAKFALNKAIGN
jgi:hypothetical protein